MIKKQTSLTMRFDITSQDVLNIMCRYVTETPKVDLASEKSPGKLVQNVCRRYLTQFGMQILREPLPENALLRRQDVISALRGVVEF